MDLILCKDLSIGAFKIREEKRKRKKNKRVYDALQRINEASEEKDSISLKSRESSTIINGIQNLMENNDKQNAAQNSLMSGSMLYQREENNR